MADRQEFIDLILDHYDHPRNRAAMVGADAVAHGGNPGCGDVVTMYLRLAAGDRLTAVTFEGEGCTISQAAASIVAEKAVGKTLSELAEMNVEWIVDQMGRDVVASRTRCAALALNTLKAAGERYRAARP
ncbi:MAG: iron-sulfur cluster assembly scaffold protein [Chloroflexi bacterium]|nr:iron-sulfur cluster assembly scaffold protein [Chloroflexota bacterium]MBI4316366.1 iron-sulfur cluster assembly scaffold protein [Chloroflexota bacterium]MBI5291038.1 iron-sulfur cluster assembly scaffold protein [Chloroflexota bacterium]